MWLFPPSRETRKAGSGFLTSVVEKMAWGRGRGMGAGMAGELCLPRLSLELWICICEAQLVVSVGAGLWRSPLSFTELPNHKDQAWCENYREP